MCSVTTTNFTDPAYAVIAGGTNDDKGGGGDGGVQKPLIVTNVNLTSKDMKNIAQAFKDGNRKVTLTRVSGKTYSLYKFTWDAFMPYESGFTRSLLSMLNNESPHDVVSLKRSLRFLRKFLKKLHKKHKVAKAVGTPAQVRIIENMISLLAVEIVSKEFLIKITPK